jgi:hypothetical protein
MRSSFIALAFAIALTVGGCGESDSSGGADAQALQDRVAKLEAETKQREADAAKDVEAAREKAREAKREALKAKRELKRKRAKAREKAARADTQEASADAGAGGIVVPNVVGMDHQAAQDVMQGEGLWLLDEKDCTGQGGRMLLFDRNWEVVRTDPPAGTHVTEDSTITLCSKKQGE